MKICIICTRFNPKRMGGVERVILDLSKQYIKKGNEVTIICKKEFDEPLNQKYKNIKIKRAKCLKVPFLKTLSAYFELRKLIKKEGADIYNPHDWSSGFLFIFGKLRKMPYVLTSHGFIGDYLNPPFFGKFAEKFVFYKTKKPITCVQKFSKNTNYIMKYKMLYIPNGVDSNKFSLSSKNAQGDYALFVGSLDERKNIKNICKVFSEGHIKLKVVGTGHLENDLKKKYGKFKNIEFLGRKEGDKLVELFQKCKFFVLPSTAEGFGLVWIEAQSCGKPIIASNVGVGPELIKDKDFGRIITNTQSIKELSEKINSLNNQINKEGTKMKKIRKFILKNYSWKKISKEYLNLFDNLLYKNGNKNRPF